MQFLREKNYFSSSNFRLFASGSNLQDFLYHCEYKCDIGVKRDDLIPEFNLG